MSDVQDYNSRRANDESRERALRSVFEMVYRLNGITPQYNTVENVSKDITNPEEYVKDRETRGCDLEIGIGTDSHQIIDEKTYLSRTDAFSNCKTWAFEISSQNNKDGMGWLFRPDSITTQYNLIYIDAKDETYTDISKIEIISISKDKVRNLLSDIGFDTKEQAEDFFYSHFQAGRDIIDYGTPSRIRINDLVSMTLSANIRPECPLNFVIDRAWLRQNADKVMRIEDMELAEKQYEQLQKSSAQKKSSVPDKEDEPKIPEYRIGITKQTRDIIIKTSKNIHKLRAIKIPETAPVIFADSDTPQLNNPKESFLATDYAVSGNSVVLKGAVGRNVTTKPVYVILGNSEKKMNVESLEYKSLSLKQQFVITGNIEDKNGQLAQDREQTPNRADRSNDGNHDEI